MLFFTGLIFGKTTWFQAKENNETDWMDCRGETFAIVYTYDINIRLKNSHTSEFSKKKCKQHSAQPVLQIRKKSRLKSISCSVVVQNEGV